MVNVQNICTVIGREEYNVGRIHCVKNVQIRNFLSDLYFTAFGPGKAPYLDTFQAVIVLFISIL